MDTLLLFFTACAPAETDTLDVSVTPSGGAYLVEWTTPSEADGVVAYGTDSLDHEADETSTGTDHQVELAGLAPATTYSVRVTSTDGDQVWDSDIVSFTTGAAPSTMPSTTVGDDGDTELSGGYDLVPVNTQSDQAIGIVNRDGEFVWWADNVELGAWRAIWTPADEQVHWVEWDKAKNVGALVSSTLQNEQTRTTVQVPLHHDFTILPNGDYLVIAYDDQVVQNQTIRGDQLVEITPATGEQRKLWSSWDHYTYTDGALTDENGDLNWPHANSLTYDASTGKIWLSMFCLDAIVQIDLATGHQDWQMGGDASDWSFPGGTAFKHQHAPVSLDGGNQLLVVDNGDAVEGTIAPAAIAEYMLDPATMSATRAWSWTDGGLHGGTLLGCAEPLSDGTVEVNWGSAGRLQNITPGAPSPLNWQVDFELGTILGFGQHIDSLGDAIPE